MKEQNVGLLCGIGVGPGDPELMTIKACRKIQESDILIFPAKSREDCYAYQIASAICPEMCKKELWFRNFPMIKEKDRLEQVHDSIYREIKEALNQGKNVSFLTIGDPTVYSTYAYIHKRACKDQIRSILVSGVPSFCAAGAQIGIDLAEKNEQIHIIPGTYDLEDSLSFSGTKIYMKSGNKLCTLLEKLHEFEEKKQIQVYGVSACGMSNERIFYGTNELKNIVDYLTIVIVKDI